MKNHSEDVTGLSIENLKGIGRERARLFAKLNIKTIGDLITYFPREYEDRSSVKKIGELSDGDCCSFKGVIKGRVSESRIRKGLSVFKAVIEDETGALQAIWFNQRHVAKAFKPMQPYMFYGKIIKNVGKLEVHNPVYEVFDGEEPASTCRIMPVYPSTSGLSQNIIRSAVRSALDLVDGAITDPLPAWLKQEILLKDYYYCLKNIHFPDSMKDLKQARYRLVFEELLILQLGLLSIRESLKGSRKGIAFKKCLEVEQLIEDLPFKLTNAQRRVFREIEADMESSTVMNRLVQGDVGSGKTVVAALALFKAVRSGYQGALMVPTSLLAEQHYRFIGNLLERYNIKTSLLTGSMSKKEKQLVCDELREGTTDIVIGTHALIEENVTFRNLGLVITDEQHRFGVRQRTALLKKGENPDMLVMTATPIPRTLALILYGDLDISIINELPPGRMPVKTYVVDESMRPRINAFIRREVLEGRQAYIICPLVEESEQMDLQSANELAQRISKEDFPDLKVGLIHGRLSPKEIEGVMAQFVQGKIDVLVSTTVVEVGVDVKNATIMVIENAERFGLAQLHQLRGRVGRGTHQSYCILYNQSDSRVARDRMEAMRTTNDGFVVSEMDLHLRGPGEFFGTRQHGIPDLKIANLYRDIEVLKKVQYYAYKILYGDRNLEHAENSGLKKMIKIRFEERLKEISLN